MCYKYTLDEVKKKNREWGKNRIIIRDDIVNYVKNNNLKFIIHDTGEADLDGRYCIALPSNFDTKNPTIRKKYNLM
jgi:hypothetical protein